MQIFKQRRENLLAKIRQFHDTQEGVVVLFSGFENPRYNFLQDSTFYYFTGINEPGVVLVVDLENNSTLYMPQYARDRSEWVTVEQDYHAYSIDKVAFLGASCDGYSTSPYFKEQEYTTLIQRLSQEKTVFTTANKHPKNYLNNFLLDRLATFIHNFNDKIIDVTLFIARLRQVKNQHEIEAIREAVNITALAHHAAYNTIKDSASEAEVQAAIEFVFTACKGSSSFPSIVGSGKNSTVLHYTQNNKVMKNGELVVVDIGAISQHYCADLARTYAVSKQFTDRQQEIVDLVIKTQAYIYSIAKPGMWLSNKNVPDKSLHHIAREFLKNNGGYDICFGHALGHYLGLDVHDMGDYNEPMQDGEVFTIEPGIYLPQENLGVRIEDDYVITKDGAACLSEQLPKIL